MRGRNRRQGWRRRAALAAGLLAGLFAAGVQLGGWRTGALCALTGLLILAALFWEAATGGEDDGGGDDIPPDG